jgi:hypothetical protein
MTVAFAVSGPLTKDRPSSSIGKDVLQSGEPIVHFARSPGRVEIELKDPGSLFDLTASVAYPHSGPMLNNAVAAFLVDSARERRQRPQVSVNITFQTPPLGAEEEASIRAKMSHYFANEIELVELEKRVNRTEGFGSLRYALSLVLLAGLGLGVLYLYAGLGTSEVVSLGELAYLTLVIIIWVMLWDPIEKLLYDPYFFRLRIRALHKLSKAEVTFAYRSTSKGAPEPKPS